MRIAAFGILLCVLGYLLSELGWRGRRVFTVLSCTGVLLFMGEGLYSVVSSLTGFCNTAGIGEVARSALKIVFVGYVFGFCADTASELGEGGVANALTLAGRVEVAVIAMPYLSEVVKTAIEVI